MIVCRIVSEKHGVCAPWLLFAFVQVCCFVTTRAHGFMQLAQYAMQVNTTSTHLLHLAHLRSPPTNQSNPTDGVTLQLQLSAPTVNVQPICFSSWGPVRGSSRPGVGERWGAANLRK